MVQLTITSAVKAAVDAYQQLKPNKDEIDIEELSHAQLGDPIAHETLIRVSHILTSADRTTGGPASDWSLDALLRGNSVYRKPPQPKPEPSAQYKALMQRLRKEEEQRQYDRMVTAPTTRNDFLKSSSTTSKDFVPQLSHGHSGHEPIDEATLKEVENQLTLIVNVLITVIASGFTIWYAARYWAVPARLALSMLGSLAIAIAEVVVYMGYVRRLQEAKTLERKIIERKEVQETWQTSTSITEAKEDAGIRYRKGKHR